jgi:hypothetical protein
MPHLNCSGNWRNADELERNSSSDPYSCGRLAFVGDEWIVARLNMGHRSNVSRAVSAYREPQAAERRKLLKILHTCTD